MWHCRHSRPRRREGLVAVSFSFSLSARFLRPSSPRVSPAGSGAREETISHCSVPALRRVRLPTAGEMPHAFPRRKDCPRSPSRGCSRDGPGATWAVLGVRIRLVVPCRVLAVSALAVPLLAVPFAGGSGREWRQNCRNHPRRWDGDGGQVDWGRARGCLQRGSYLSIVRWQSLEGAVLW